MRHLLAGAVGAALLLSFGGCSAPVDEATVADGAAKVGEVGEAYAAKLGELSVSVQLQNGEPITELADVTLEATRELADWARELLTELDPVDPDRLERQDWLSYELLRWDLDLLVEAPEHYWTDINITPYAAGGFLFSAVHQAIAAQKLTTDEERRGYLQLVDEYAAMIEQLADKVDGQIERGIYLPKVQVPNVQALFAGYRAGAAALLTPAVERLGDEPADEFLAQVGERLTGQVDAAFARLLASIGDEYVDNANEAVGLASVPGGPELYRYRVRQQSTTDKTPEEIHEIGLAQVALLEEQMATIREQLGIDDTMAEFYDRVRGDERFIASSPAEVEERYMGYVARIEPLIDQYFEVLPQAPYGVRRLDPALEPTMTFGVYEPPTESKERGEYRYNGSDLSNRSLFSAQGLIYHELIPGHHFHVARQVENTSLPEFRRQNIAYAAFTEGWAEYAANLGKEMGLYDDPWDLYGRLAMEMFVSCRLVVDTGMNAMGWSLEQAREFMAPRIVYSDVELATELLRYSADIHGQALAYRMGTLEITALRAQAEEALGDAFDVRAFHEAVVGSGALPMTVLRRHVERWIAEQQS